MIRRHFGLSTLAILAGPVEAMAGRQPTAVLYKNPQCGCCEAYAAYLRQSGYEVTVEPSFDLPLIKRRNGVPEALEGCHTTLVGGYVVEGHVPAAAVDRLLDERPAIRGIAVPGMPAGSPGMFGDKAGPLTVYEIAADAAPKVFAIE